MKIDMIEAAGLILAVSAIILSCFFIMEHPFPAFQYASSTHPPEYLVESTENVGRAVSIFVWKNRNLDLIAQALVLFSAAAGCLSILRVEKRREGEV